MVAWTRVTRLTRPLVALLLALAPLLALVACDTRPASEPFSVLSGSENRALEGLIQEFARGQRLDLRFTYKGSVDIMLELEQGAATPYDAVWPANSMWLSLGDKQNVVKHQESVMRSPVVLAVKKSVAERLGWIGREVTVDDILSAAEAGRLRFMMTSASQSNSGASAYFGYLYAFAGKPEVLTSQHLRDPAVQERVKRILGQVNRTAASTGFLLDLFVERYDAFDAAVLYESLVIEGNQRLLQQRREPLYAIYPVDGLAIADSPLGFVDKGDPNKAEVFRRLQGFLRAPETQSRLLGLGWRAGPLGVNPGGASGAVFRAEWGIDTGRVLTPIKFPGPDVIREALVLYQTAFRKPSLTAFCLDLSGSMGGRPEEDLRAAMNTLLDQRSAGRYLLQASPDDLTAVLAFNSSVTYASKTARGAEVEALLPEINRLRAGGGTNMYECAKRAYSLIDTLAHEDFATALIIMTDGKSEDRYDDLRRHVGALRLRDLSDVPIYAIKFGDADERQLVQLARDSSGRVFDGKADLIAAFREVKGYN